jgi:hypothetical protein
METSTLSPDAYRLVRTIQVFGAWLYKDWDPIQQELLNKKFARLDITRTRLVLTEWGRAIPRTTAPH